MSVFGSSFRALRARTGLDVVFGGIARRRANHFAISNTDGGRSDRLEGLVIRSGHGLGGLVLSAGRGASVHDYLNDDRITHAYDDAVAAEQLRSVTAVPIAVRGEVRGVLYGATRGTLPDPDAIATMRRAAEQMSFDLAVDEAVTRRAELVMEATAAAADVGVPAREWEDVRLAFAELRQLAHDVDDSAIRTRLDAILARMTRPQCPNGPALSAREVDVLALVALGCGNAEIGERLTLQPETVKSYLRTASRKLGAANRVEAVRLARASGQLP